MQFDGSFDTSETLTLDIQGFRFTARIEPDDLSDPPWECDDGHGPVSEWTSRAKSAGEVVLTVDRLRQKRYYDMQEATKIALRDCWGVAGDTTDREPRKGDPGYRTKKQIAAAAAKADFQRLKAWCEGRWQYVGVIVSVSLADVVQDNRVTLKDVMLNDRASALWGIESDDTTYLTDVANDLLSEALIVGRQILAGIAAKAVVTQEVTSNKDQTNG